jgi:intracellular multiplication protein IcmP
MAASGGGGGQDQSDKSAYAIVWLLVLVVIVCLIVWYLFSTALKLGFIYLRIAELSVVNFFFGLFSAGFPFIGEQFSQIFAKTSVNLAAARLITPATLNLEIAGALSDVAGEYLRYPLMLVLMALSFFIFKVNVHLRLRKKFNMRSLSAQEQKNWPQIKIATTLDLVSADIDSGPWAMTMSPIQFAKRNKLMAITVNDAAIASFSKTKLPEFNLTLDKMRTERAIVVQLGRSWHSVEMMPLYRQAILAVFAARGCRNTKAANALMAQLADSGATGTPDCAGVAELWKKHATEKRVQEIFKQHAYEFTVFISMLLFAREDGVVASADYLWVKPLDRRLWYVINNVGRQTPSVEVAGIFSHWNYEMALKRPLSAPRVEEAVSALELAISEIFYVPDPAEREELLKQAQAAKATASDEEPLSA